jgi:DNA-binding CsgD family transcriptional regulator
VASAPTRDEPGTDSSTGSRIARESEVLQLITAGKTNVEVAEVLALSERTVEHHAANLYAKIGARGRPDAVAFAHRLGLA